MLKQILYILVAACFFMPSNAQEKNAELEKISEDYYHKHNEHFIIADLLKDGIIKQGEPYEVNYERDRLFVKGASLPEPYKTTYHTKIAKHFDNLEVPHVYRVLKFKGERMDMNLLYANNYTRNMSVHNTYNPDVQLPPVCPDGADLELLRQLEANYVDMYKNDSVLIHLLVADKIIQKAANVHIRYGKNECWVNGVQVAGNVDKYVSLAKKINADITHDDNEFYGLNYSTYEIMRFGFCNNKN